MRLISSTRLRMHFDLYIHRCEERKRASEREREIKRRKKTEGETNAPISSLLRLIVDYWWKEKERWFVNHGTWWVRLWSERLRWPRTTKEKKSSRRDAFMESIHSSGLRTLIVVDVFELLKGYVSMFVFPNWLQLAANGDIRSIISPRSVERYEFLLRHRSPC